MGRWQSKKQLKQTAKIIAKQRVVSEAVRIPSAIIIDYEGELPAEMLKLFERAQIESHTRLVFVRNAESLMGITELPELYKKALELASTMVSGKKPTYMFFVDQEEKRPDCLKLGCLSVSCSRLAWVQDNLENYGLLKQKLGHS